MASQPAMSGPRITIGRAGKSPIGTVLMWLPLSVVAAAIGAMVGWEVRSFGISANSDAAQEALRYVATIASVLVIAGVQWWLLERGRIDAYWWIPGTVAAQLLATVVVIPSVVRLFFPANPVPVQSFNPSLLAIMMASGTALAAAGLLVGGAQALILRASVGRVAWLWVPATMIGNAISGSVTSAVSSHFLMVLLPQVAVALTAAIGTIFIAGCQLVVLPRLVR